MMAVEVKDTAFGKLVPEHLLTFTVTGTSHLNSYYRDLLKTSYEKGFERMNLGECTICHIAQTVNDRPRLKSLPRMTRKIHRLLIKQTSGRQLGKYGQHIVNKYLQSKQQMIVKCPSCQSVNRMSLMSKENLILLKSQHLMKVESLTRVENESISTKKKKRKKKQKTRQTFAPNSLLPLRSEDSTLMHSQSSLKKHDSIPSQGKQSRPLQDLIKSTKENKSASSLLQKSLRASTSSKQEKTLISRQSEKKKSISKQKQLKEFLKESMSCEKSASLSDFLSSL